jgi:hypothetical protein
MSTFADEAVRVTRGLFDFVRANLGVRPPSDPKDLKPYDSVVSFLAIQIRMLQLVSSLLTQVFLVTGGPASVDKWYSVDRNMGLDCHRLFEPPDKVLMERACTTGAADVEFWNSRDVEASYWPLMLRCMLAGRGNEGTESLGTAVHGAVIATAVRLFTVNRVVVDLMNVVDAAWESDEFVQTSLPLQALRLTLHSFTGKPLYDDPAKEVDPSSIIAKMYHFMHFGAPPGQGLDTSAADRLYTVLHNMQKKYGPEVASAFETAANRAARDVHSLLTGQLLSKKPVPSAPSEERDDLEDSRLTTEPQVSWGSSVGTIGHSLPVTPTGAVLKSRLLDVQTLNLLILRMNYLFRNEAIYATSLKDPRFKEVLRAAAQQDSFHLGMEKDTVMVSSFGGAPSKYRPGRGASLLPEPGDAEADGGLLVSASADKTELQDVSHLPPTPGGKYPSQVLVGGKLRGAD